MKPIAVFQHTVVGAPGSVAPILESLGCEVQIIKIVDGESVPKNASAFSGLIFMGGYMSVHDDLPWIPLEMSLIRDADARGLSLIGHCLGSQLVAAALGGTVRRHVAPEIGWQYIQTENDTISSDWWGEFAGRELQTFQWHGDTFLPPLEAHRIAHSEYCENQAFVVRGRHLLMQSHLEMTPDLVELGLQNNGEQLKRQYANGNPAVSAPSDALNDLDARTSAMRHILTRLYSRWLEGVAK